MKKRVYSDSFKAHAVSLSYQRDSGLAKKTRTLF